jgi:adenylylsulfate kinase
MGSSKNVIIRLADDCRMAESRKRSIIKMLTYRAILTALLAVVSWVFTGNLGQTTVITIVFSAAATAIYYLHERVWNNVRWGVRT